jgi:hypothetical protein
LHRYCFDGNRYNSLPNGFSLGTDNHYNEFQSDSKTTKDNTANAENKDLNLPIKPLEQVKIARLMLGIKRLAHQHEQNIYSLAS